MKIQHLLFFGVFSIFLSATIAHSAEDSKVGLLIGPDFVSYSTSYSNTKTQFTGGILYERFFMPQFSIQPEMRYTNKSATSTSYDFLTFPVLFKGHILTPSSVTPNLEFGPDFNVKLSGPNGTSGFIFALDFGGGVDAVVAPKTALTFDFRYSLGLTDVYVFDSKTREIMLLFGAKFTL